MKSKYLIKFKDGTEQIVINVVHTSHSNDYPHLYLRVDYNSGNFTWHFVNLQEVKYYKEISEK